MELHIIAAWTAFAVSIILPIAVGYFMSKRGRRTPDPLLGVVLPKEQNKQTRTKR